MPENSTPPRKKRSNLHRVEKYYDEFAQNYDETYEENSWRLYDDLTWHFLQPAMPPIKNPDSPPQVLDIGGGTGKWALKLAQLGYIVICGDISQLMLNKAKEKAQKLGLLARIDFRILDIRNMENLKSNSFDLVIALGDVISYALDDDDAVKELYRVTKPDGFCVASVDNTMMYIINEIKYDHFERIPALLETKVTDFFGPHPIRTFLPEDLKLLFERHGFIVEHLVGKPVISSLMARKVKKHKLDSHYDFIFNLEKRFGEHPNYIGHGGHLQITAKKPL
jgi:ubiquinone/menaquinone biosynthesis C-methylase UbiE